MVKYRIVLFFLMIYVNIGCSQGLGPGYSFDLFKNTANSELAMAVDQQNELKIKKLVAEKKGSLNFQEPKFGNTLLHLAVANDKLNATKALLEEGADVNIIDSERNAAIHEATKFVNLNKNSAEILLQLIKHGSDVNNILFKIKNSDTTYWYVPFMGASKNLVCGKILLENGANLYLRNNNSYPVWYTMLANDVDESIYVARYIIVEKKMPIPYAISYSFADSSVIDIYNLLAKANFRGDTQKEQAKQDILNYLEKINFPTSGAYQGR